MFKCTLTKERASLLLSTGVLSPDSTVEVTCFADVLNFLNKEEQSSTGFRASARVVCSVPNSSELYYVNFEADVNFESNPLLQVEADFAEYLQG